MGATAVLTSPVLSVDPGGEATLEVTVRNTGSVVDELNVEAVGDVSPWVSFEPSTVSLLPGAEETVQARFLPPRSPRTPAGEVPFAVKVSSREDPLGSVVEEGVLHISPFHDLFAELVPRTARGRRRARFDLALDNRGNTRVNASLEALDADDLLSFSIDPPAVTAEPGAAAFAAIVARPRRRFLRGPAVTRPFEVTVEPEDAPRLVADGTLLQEALVPRWLPRALLALLGLLLLLAVLWATLLKPTIESAAGEAVEEAVEETVLPALVGQQEQIAALEEATTGTTSAPSVATTTTLAPAGGVLGTSFDGRLAATAADQQVSFPVPAASEISITDLVLQNPNGDRGEMRIGRGDGTLLVLRLENFRDLDYHFVSPVVLVEGQPLTLDVQCENGPPPPAPDGDAAGDPAACTPAIYFTGFIRPVA